jgi:hypothetical protein
MPDIQSSPGLELSRAPRLRRIAELVESQADRAADPAKARAIARGMRLRAAELEMGIDRVRHDEKDVDEEISALRFELE